MNVIGLKKCPKCGFKELYGCHNYYTTGQPFFCPKCGSMMDWVSYIATDKHLSDKEYEKVWDFLQVNLATLDYKIKRDPNRECVRIIEWIGLSAVKGN